MAASLLLVFVTGFNVCVDWSFSRVYDWLDPDFDTFATFASAVAGIAVVLEVIGLTLLVLEVLRRSRPNQAMHAAATASLVATVKVWDWVLTSNSSSAAIAA
jgi:hypothetical protein